MVKIYFYREEVNEEDEKADPEHSGLLKRALDQAGISCAMEIGSTGGYGLADGFGMCMKV